MDAYRTHSGQYEPEQDPGGSGHWNPIFRPDSEATMRSQEQSADTFLDSAEASHPSTGPPIATPLRSSEEAALARNISTMSFQAHAWHVEDVEEAREAQKGSDPHHAGEDGLYQDHADQDSQDRSHGSSVSALVVENPSLQGAANGHQPAAGVVNGQNIGDEIPAQVSDDEPVVTHIEHAEVENHPEQPFRSRPKHESFARTVSHDIPWADSDEAEPTGTSTNLNFDAFSGTGEVDSSNAFPDIHPVSQSQNANSTIVPPESVEDNSIEDVIWDPHQTKNAQEWDLTNGGNVQNGWGQDQANLEEMFDAFGKTGSENTTLLDAEARYEEGIPLIPHTSDVSEDQGNVESIQATDGVGGWGESGTDDFFSQQGGASTENQGDSFIPQPLDRKSTSQVLDSLNFRPHHETHDDPSNFDRRQSIVGGGVAVTTSTVISQIVEETKETAEGQVVEAKEEDLTAMWKAALDDDEFLDDTTEKPLDPSAFFEDDGEGFLEDIEPTAQQPTLSHSPDVPRPVYGEDGQVKGFSAVSTSGVTSESSRPGTSSRYIPAQSNVQSQPQPPPLGSPYTPSGPQFSNTQSTQNVFTPSPYSNFGTPSTQAPSGGAAPPWTYGAPSQPQQARPTVNQSESFVAKSKDGYSSPYDLPMEVLRPRKQPSMQRMTTFGQGQTPPGAPPLRSSSFGSRPPTASAHPSSSPNHPPTASTPSNQNFPQTAPPANQAQPQSGALPPSAKSGSPSSFFEELPVTAKPHRPSSSGRYTPQSNLPAGPPQQLPPPQIPRQQSPDSYLPPVSQQLQAPPKIDPYANVPLTQPPAPAPPVAVSRYSPAPPPKPGTMLGSTPASNRYAAPPRNSSQTPPFQPRTSSPLAHSEVSAQSLGTPFEVQSRPPGPQQPPYGTAQRPASRGAALRSVSNLATPMEEDETALDSTAPALGTPTTSQSPVLQHRPPPSRQDSRYTPSNIISTAATVNSQVLAQAPPQADLSFPPPRRSQTQSPGQMAAASISTIQSQRPVSSQSVPGVVSPIAPTSPVRRRQRGPSQTFNYIVPTDGREQDPLDRWKGCPIFNWGIGGTVITSFPRQIPRYNAGQAIPMMKISPGEVNVRQIKDILPLADHLAKFPGPLRSKGKKKEVVTWMKRRIDDLSPTASIGNFDSFNVGERQRLEEKTLLWQILCALVENDGQLDGSPTVVNAVRNILSPEMASDKIDPNMLYSASSDIPSISASSLSKMESENIDPDAINELRKFLLQGEREKAVWHAVDKRLWAHALLVSSTLSKDIWKQVVQEFVRQEIKSLGENAESMAALYQIFAGNWEESIDELVPPSARAGFQFVNTGDTGSKRDALEGLNKWKETLSLVVNNRVPEDGQALIALGKLLMGYGRVEAAHTCFMFARPYSVFSSSEDPQTSMALIGADHLQQPFDFGRDMDAILLSEIYEFALSLSAASGVSSVVPHLQAYKLNHAITLAEYGYRNEAKEYCDAIFSSIKSSTKLSPYYNVVLLGMLDELNKRLQNSPKDGSSSWFSRPSMKVSESVWSKFNNFVAGEESDTASTGSGKGNTLDVGPFAGIAPGSSPAISRTASAMDLYSMYPAGASGHSPPTSRYAPNGGAYAPRSSMEQSGRSSNEYSRSPYEPSRMSIDSQHNQYSSSPSETIHNNYQPKAISSVNRSVSEPHPQAQTFPSAQSFTPYQPSAPELASPFQPYEPVQYGQEAEPGDIPVGAGYERPASEYQPPTSSYEPPSYEPPAADDGYMPPTDDSMYKPPSYAGPEGDNDAGEEEAKERPKKKSFMDDDDDDFAARAEALKREEKARKDREADEAVLKAAEADAQRDKQPPKSSWFGGWFGKKESNELGGPIKAKLGEENSFYYDPDLKKWVNKRAGGTPEPTKATPPPPKGPPSRSVSAGNPPMLGTPPPPSSSRIPSATMPPMATPSSVPAAPQRTASPTTIALTTGGDPLMPPAGRPPISRPTSAAPPSGPPSRPATSMSNASSIDDLLGAPTARKGGTVRGAKGKKGSRYVDVMAK